jgi:hypothetical protein
LPLPSIFGGGRYAEVEGIQALEKRERDAGSHPRSLVSRAKPQLFDKAPVSKIFRLVLIVAPDYVRFLVPADFPRDNDNYVAVAHPDVAPNFSRYPANALLAVLALHLQPSAAKRSYYYSEYFALAREAD